MQQFGRLLIEAAINSGGSQPSHEYTPYGRRFVVRRPRSLANFGRSARVLANALADRTRRRLDRRIIIM